MKLLNAFPEGYFCKRILVPGGAFRAPFEFKSEGVKWRFFFILNQTPQSDSDLVIATATTKIQETIARFPTDGKALVHLSPSDYAEIEEDSLVDCGACQIWSRQEIIERIPRKDFLLLDPLPPVVLDRMKLAVMESRRLDNRTKRFVVRSHPVS